MRLDTLVELLLRRHFHHAVQFRDAGILAPSHQSAYDLDTLVKILVIDMRQSAAIPCQYRPDPEIQRYVDPLPGLVLLQVYVVIAVGQPAVHGLVDTLIVAHTLPCQASYDKDVLRLVQQPGCSPGQLIPHHCTLLVVRRQPHQPLNGLLILKVGLVEFLKAFVRQVDVLHVLGVNGETAALKLCVRGQFHVLGRIEEDFQVFHMPADGVGRIGARTAVLVLLLEKEPAPVIIEVQRHVVEVDDLVSVFLISLQLRQRASVTADGAVRDIPGTLAFQPLSGLALTDKLLYPVHQRHPAGLSLLPGLIPPLLFHLIYNIWPQQSVDAHLHTFRVGRICHDHTVKFCLQVPESDGK